MTAKQYLRQIKTLDIKISRRKRQVEELKDMAVNITAPMDGERVQTSGAGDKTADLAARWIDMESEVQEMIGELAELKNRIIGEIHQLDDPRYIQLLEMRYIDCFTFDEIADCMMMDVRHIYRLHGQALEDFRKKVMKGAAE